MIFMASTGISAEKTASEISTILSRSSIVKYIQFEYDEGIISGISFIIMAGEKRIPFKLPARVEPVYKALYRSKKTKRTAARINQARRVAWRQILRWIQAQMAMIEVGMVDIKEVFLPYMAVEGKTFYEVIEQKQFMIEYKEK